MLRRELVVDLGVFVHELWGYPGISTSPEGTTVITVPDGFDHDGSSIPSGLPIVLSLILGDEDRYEVAGVVHDWLWRIGVPYAAGNRVWWIVARSGAQRVGPVAGWVGWAGLMLGGWPSYRRYARERRGEQ